MTNAQLTLASICKKTRMTAALWLPRKDVSVIWSVPGAIRSVLLSVLEKRASYAQRDERLGHQPACIMDTGSTCHLSLLHSFSKTATSFLSEFLLPSVQLLHWNGELDKFFRKYLFQHWRYCSLETKQSLESDALSSLHLSAFERLLLYRQKKNKMLPAGSVFILK